MFKAVLRKSCLIFLLGIAPGGLLARAADLFSVAPPPSWVNVQKNLSPGTNSADKNVRYLLLDDQVNVSQQEHYHRVVEQPVNPDGVQDCVQISIDFDPSCEQLAIHSILIRRGTNLFNRLDPAKIKVIQQERDLDMNIFNGEKSAVLFLEDVQVGDQIDYSYTITGSNPIFARHYLDSFETLWGATVIDERFRLLWPANRFLGIKNHGTDVKPAIRQDGTVTEYLWELHNPPVVTEEDSLPSWYDAYPWVQFTEFSTWKQVEDWAQTLYPPPAQLDPQLRKKIADIEQSCPDPESRLAATLAFVQDDIRYMGIEVGPNSHQPNDPSLVFQRRFGDCKDKAYLFCTMLRAMDIDAAEVLVNTENLGTTADWLPSPYAFNHVVARVQLKGKIYWLDPTELNQGGKINDRYFPDYGYGLVVARGITNLSRLQPPRAGWPKTTIHETFSVHGRNDPADFTVQTLAQGLDADTLRQEFADQGRPTLQKNYLNYYAREYPKIKMTKPLEVFDHREPNTFETIEHYQIQDFWTLGDDQKNYTCDFSPQTIRDLFDDPTTTLRSMPLAISYPCHEILQTEVLLPEAWPLTNETDHFESSAARLDFQREVGSNRFEMTYEYQTLTNCVSPEGMPAYIATLDRMKNALGYSLIWAKDAPAAAPSNPPGQVNWTIVFLGGIYLLLLAILAVIVHQRYRGKPRPPLLPSEMKPPISGIRGWLILPTMSLFLSPIRTLFGMVSNASAFSPATWQLLTDPSSASYNSWWAPLLIYEFLVNLTIITFAIFLLVLLFQHRRTFRDLFILFLLFATVTMTIDHFSAKAVAASAHLASGYDPQLTQDFIACMVWIPYMLVSKRVKATFTR